MSVWFIIDINHILEIVLDLKFKLFVHSVLIDIDFDVSKLLDDPLNSQLCLKSINSVIVDLHQTLISRHFLRVSQTKTVVTTDPSQLLHKEQLKLIPATKLDRVMLLSSLGKF